jgi:hypothetical protein
MTQSGGAESATVGRQSGGDFLTTDGPYTEIKARPLESVPSDVPLGGTSP